MIQRLASFVLASTILCAVCVASASADTQAGTAVKSDGANTQPAPRADGGREAKRGEKLKADVSKMISDAREGRGRSTTPPRQQPPAQSNSLSKGQKVLIVTAITVGVLAIIYFSVFAGKHL